MKIKVLVKLQNSSMFALLCGFGLHSINGINTATTLPDTSSFMAPREHPLTTRPVTPN
jgi:hypothetical protein